MLIASGFSWFHLIPGVEDGSFLGLGSLTHGHTYVFVGAWFVFAVVTAFGFAVRSGINAATARGGLAQYHADESLNARTVGEMVVGAFYDMMKGMMDSKYAQRFLPLIVGLAIYIFVSNLLALIPGFQPPTDNVNTNVAMAVIVMVTYMLLGLIIDAKGFIGHLMGPMAILVPLLLPLELLSYIIIRPASLTLRLTCNIFGDHLVYNIMSGLVPILWPVPFLALGLLVSLIQAYVFALLTTVYLSTSLPHADHGHGDHH